MKLFNIDDILSSEEMEIEYNDMLSIESEIVDGLTAVNNAEVSLTRLSKQLAIEESVIKSGNATVETLQMSTEMYNDVCVDLGLESMVLSVETANLPSTDVNYDADMRKVNDDKKSLFKKIVEGIEKIFIKLWKKAKQLQAKILIVLGNSESKLRASIMALKKSNYSIAINMSWDKLGQKAGFYHHVSGQNWTTDLLVSLMGDDEVMVMAANDIGTLNDCKTLSSFNPSDFKLTSSSNLESKVTTNGITKSKELMNILKGAKDIDNVLAKGKITSVNGKSITLLNIVDNGSTDEISKLASRKIVTNNIHLPFTASFKDPRTFDKKVIISFAEDLLKTYAAFDKYTKNVDEFVNTGDKLLKEAGNNTVPELANVMRSSLVIYNKLALGLSTTKRVEVVKMLNMLTGVVGAYAR